MICGEDIEIEEMPQGCVITQGDKEITVSSFSDALLLVESLNRMLDSITFTLKE